MPADRRTILKAAPFAVAATMSASALAQVKPLAGKSILITGASSGFGYIGALHYARAGAKVIASMRGLPRPEADKLAHEAKAEKLDVHIVEIDILSDEQVARGVAEAERIAGGAIDVLVNNAGIVVGGPVEVHDMESVKLQFDTNLFGMQRMQRAVLPAMRKRKSGLIVNISSQAGRVIYPSGGFYSPTKFAVEAMSEQLAYELVPHNIDVVIIQPGGFPTEVGQNRARHTQAVHKRIEAKHADGHPALVEQMANMRTARSGPLPQGMPDPILVPQAIAEIAAMPAGTRPLRRAVHPGSKPQLEINRVSAAAQLTMLGSGPFGPWVKAALD